MVEIIQILSNNYNFLLTNYKLDSTKKPKSRFMEIYKDIYKKILIDNNNLDIQHYLKIIDSIQLSIQPNEEDLYLIATNGTILAMQMNTNPNKREQFVKFIENNFKNIIKHDVIHFYI